MATAPPLNQTTQLNSVVARYDTHEAAEAAVRELDKSGVPMTHVSIIGKDWQVREDLQGFYHPGDAIKEGAKSGAWFGGLFGLLLGFGFFLVPIAGAVLVLGPLAGLIAGAVGGAGIGAIAGSLITLGVPEDAALKYQSHVQAGSFLVIVHGPASEITQAHSTLGSTSAAEIDAHGTI